MTFALKDYQTRALAALSQFLIDARSGSVTEAFKKKIIQFIAVFWMILSLVCA